MFENTESGLLTDEGFCIEDFDEEPETEEHDNENITDQ